MRTCIYPHMYHEHMHNEDTHMDIHNYIMSTCIMSTCIMSTCIMSTCIMSTCIMSTCIMRTHTHKHTFMMTKELPPPICCRTRMTSGGCVMSVDTKPAPPPTTNGTQNV